MIEIRQQERAGTRVMRKRRSSDSRHGKSSAVQLDRHSDFRRRLGALHERVAGSLCEEAKVEGRRRLRCDGRRRELELELL